MIDLQVQRLQTVTIELQTAGKELENGMETTDLADIFGWVQDPEGQFSEYYNELWHVKTAVRYEPSL
jgi:hypothetical protein